MNRAEQIADLIIGANLPGIKPAWREHIVAAFNTKTGQLLKNRPRDDRAMAAWMGFQPNPWKISVGALLMASNEAREIFAVIGAFRWPVRLDPDANTLNQLGVWR